MWTVVAIFSSQSSFHVRYSRQTLELTLQIDLKLKLEELIIKFIPSDFSYARTNEFHAVRDIK